MNGPDNNFSVIAVVLEDIPPFKEVDCNPEKGRGDALLGVPLELTDLLLEPLQECSEEYALLAFLGGVWTKDYNQKPTLTVVWGDLNKLT